MFTPVGQDGWPTRVRLPVFTLSNDDIDKARAKTAHLLRPRTPANEPLPTEAAAEPESVPALTNEIETSTPLALQKEAVSACADIAWEASVPEEASQDVDVATRDEPVATSVDAPASPAPPSSALRQSSAPHKASPPTEPLYLRLYEDAKRIEDRRQSRADALHRNSRTAERDVCTFHPQISPRAQRMRQRDLKRIASASPAAKSNAASSSHRPVSATSPRTKSMSKTNAMDETVLSHDEASPSPSPSPGVSPCKKSAGPAGVASTRQPDERDPSQYVFDRLYSEASRRAQSMSQKRAASIKTVEDEKGQTCTFRPHISPHAQRSHRYSNFDDFLAAQEEHRLIHQNRLRQLEKEQFGECGQPARATAAGAVEAKSPGGSPSAEKSVSAALKAALDKDHGYKGPISGWHEHAEAYWRSRNSGALSSSATTSPHKTPARSLSASRSKKRDDPGAPDGSVYARLYKAYAEKEAERQCVAMAQLEIAHAEFFKPRLNGTEALATRRRRPSPACQAENTTEPEPSSTHPSRGRAGAADTVFEELYQDGVALQRKRQSQQLSEEEARIAGCPFTPHVNPESERILIDLAVKMARDGAQGEPDDQRDGHDAQNEATQDKAEVVVEATQDKNPRVLTAKSSSTSPRGAAKVPNGAPQLHLLRLAQYRRESASKTGLVPEAGQASASSPSPRKGSQSVASTPSAQRRRSQPDNRSPSGRRNQGPTVAADFLARNAQLLQRRQSRAVALKEAEAEQDVENCTFRPALAPVTERMAEGQQRYLQVVDGLEGGSGGGRGSGWRRQSGSASSSKSPRARCTSYLSGAASPHADVIAAQRVAESGPTPQCRTPLPRANTTETMTSAASHTFEQNAFTLTAAHRPRVIPIANTTPHNYGDGGGGDSVRRGSSARRGSSVRSSRDGTPLRPSQTPLQALASGQMPVTVDPLEGWVRAGSGGLVSKSNDPDVAVDERPHERDSTAPLPSAVNAALSAAPVPQDYLKSLEAELNATLDRWSHVA